MRTRQLRLDSREQILAREETLIEKKINIVMRDQTVLLAILDRISENHLHVRNLRLKKMSIPLTEVREVYLDTIE